MEAEGSTENHPTKFQSQARSHCRGIKLQNRSVLLFCFSLAFPSQVRRRAAGRCSVRCLAPSPCTRPPARREAPPRGRRFGRPDSGPPASRRRPVSGTRQRDGGMSMNQCAGFLFPSAQRTGPRPPMAEAPSTGHAAMRRCTKVAEGNTGRPLRQRDEEKRQREEDDVPRVGAGGDWLGTGADGISNTVRPRSPVSSISRSKSRRKILKKIAETEEWMEKQHTKFRSHS